MASINFVGRTEHLERILPADRKGRGPSIFFSVEGIPGIGKRELAERLFSLAGKQGRTAVRIDCGEVPAWSSGGGAPPDEATEFRNFRSLLRQAERDLLLLDTTEASTLIDYLNGELSRARAERLRSGYSGSGSPSRVSTRPMNLEEYLDTVVDASTKLAELLAGRQARLLVLIGDFHLIASRPLGGWLLNFLSGVQEADVVLLHQELRGPAAVELPPGAVALPLGNLSRADVEAYLRSQDIGLDVTGIDEAVWDFTHGHPQALALAADLIKEILKEGGSIQRSVGMIRQIDAVQGGRDKQLEVLVDRIVNAIEEELRNALYTVCIPRHFDTPLLQHLVDGLDEPHAQTIIERLGGYSFVEPPMPGRPYLAITGFVREVIASRLDVNPARQQAIHQRAREYYEGLMLARWDENDTSYNGWYRQEEPDFQTYRREWLYHLGSLTGSHRQEGRISIARVFFDAFWWWGSYVHYQFCEDLLADWSAGSGDQLDRVWGKLLSDVYKNYPRDWQKPVPAEKWADILETLLVICRYGEFDGAQPKDPQLRHVRAIIDCYLADAVRYADPADQEADEWLDDAGELFEADGDEWNLAWVEYARADLAVMRKQAELATSLVTQSAQDHIDLGDDELLANLNRVWSDAQWMLGDHGAALDAAARAVAHAYRFQLTGATPDTYTAAFQKEMTGRAIKQLADLHANAGDTDHAILRAAITRIHDFFAPYWRALRQDPMTSGSIDVIQALAEGRLGDVAVALFPAGPDDTDLNQPGTQYAKTSNLVRVRMTSKLAQPPGTPLATPDGPAG